MTWFENNYIKMNSDNCNLISGNKYEQMPAEMEEHKIWETRTVKLLDIIIDNGLKYKNINKL